jgi:hypothetical protein
VGNFLNLEATVKRILLSPVTSLLMSLSLVVGILVCDLTGMRAFPAASAQTASVLSVPTSAATVSGGVITARGVLINGVVTDAVFVGSVNVSNSVLDTSRGVARFASATSGGVYILGAYPAPAPEPVGGAYPAPAPEPIEGAYPAPAPEPVDGAYPAPGPEPVGGAYPAPVIIVGDGLEVIGGALQGDNIQVTGGVITGENLVLVGAYVKSSGAQ